MKSSILPYIIIVSFALFPSASTYARGKKKSEIHLHPYYKIVSQSEIEEIPHIIIREKKENQGFIGYSTISHDYEAKIIKDDKVIIDYVTGLMWHQAGSIQNMSWKRAKKWVRDLNEKGFAGFSDWRLPTLEEAVSLLKPNEKNGNQFIDPVFDKTQSSIWTGDSNVSDASLSLDRAWSVNFNNGLVSGSDIMFERKKLRPVCIFSAR